MCVAAMSLCMIVLIVTRKRGGGRYYFALWQTNNNTPNKLLLSAFAVCCLLRVRSVSFTSRAKGCIKFVPHSSLVTLSHKVGVFLEEAICYFSYAKFAVMLSVSINWKSMKKNVFYFLVQYTQKCINFNHLSHKPITLCVIYSKWKKINMRNQSQR
jgi:hypothetical protein